MKRSCRRKTQTNPQQYVQPFSFYYRPQTRFGAKLYFYTCLSVILFTGGKGEYLGRYPPGPGTPPRPGTPPGTRYTPQDQVHPHSSPPGPGTPPQDRYNPRPGTNPQDQVHIPRTRYTPLGPGTPMSPQDQVHPQDRYTPRTRYTPARTRYTPQDQVHTPQDQVHPPEQCMLGDTGNKRAIRILLECILVLT